MTAWAVTCCPPSSPPQPSSSPRRRPRPPHQADACDETTGSCPESAGTSRERYGGRQSGRSTRSWWSLRASPAIGHDHHDTTPAPAIAALEASPAAAPDIVLLQPRVVGDAHRSGNVSTAVGRFCLGRAIWRPRHPPAADSGSMSAQHNQRCTRDACLGGSRDQARDGSLKRPALPEHTATKRWRSEDWCNKVRSVAGLCHVILLPAGPTRGSGRHHRRLKVQYEDPWWARLGLNQRPLRCQRSALPLSYAPGRPWSLHGNEAL